MTNRLAGGIDRSTNGCTVHSSSDPSDLTASGGRCVVADQLLGLDCLHLLALNRLGLDTAPRAEYPRGVLRLIAETDRPEPVACRTCGIFAADHARRMADAPCFGTTVKLIWRKRRWRCRGPRCPTSVWSEEHPALPARGKLTNRAVARAMQTLRWDDFTVSALVRPLGVDWHTLMNAIRVEPLSTPA